MRLVQHDHVVEQLSAELADETFDMRILPRALQSRAHFPDATALQRQRHAVAVDAVIATEQVPGLRSERHGETVGGCGLAGGRKRDRIGLSLQAKATEHGGDASVSTWESR
jgi:hypothetical protein